MAQKTLLGLAQNWADRLGGVVAVDGKVLRQSPEPLALAEDAVAGAALSLEVSAEAEVFRRAGAELCVGGGGWR